MIEQNEEVKIGKPEELKQQQQQLLK